VKVNESSEWVDAGAQGMLMGWKNGEALDIWWYAVRELSLEDDEDDDDDDDELNMSCLEAKNLLLSFHLLTVH
jgi:hypothetical protein